MADDDFDPSDPTGEFKAGTAAGEGPGTQSYTDAQKKSDQEFLAKEPSAKSTSESDTESALPSSTDMYKLGLKNYLDAEAQIEKNNARLQPLQDRINQYLAQPLPQVPQLQQMPQPPSQQQLNQQLNKGRFEYLAIGLPLAYLLGRRGKNAGWFAMGAFGEGLNQLQKNNIQGAKDMFSTWQEAAKYAQEENKQRIDLYKMVLENRNLTLNQQTTLIENLSKQLNDPYVHQAAVAKDMIKIAGEIAKGENAGTKFKQETDRLTKTYLRGLSEKDEGRAYGSFIKRKFGYDPYASEENLARADQDYPYYKWDAEYKKESATHGEERAGEEDPLGLKGGEADKKAAEDILKGIGLE